MFRVVSRGQCGTRNVSYSFVQSVGISRYFSRFRVASVVLEMCHVARGVVRQSGI